ncbi:MAG TPA: tRNA (adenosine(37)-N6)-threonylcarbamoyltransferase complex dimerization subunit type 1 TsaB [Terriglobia bacterium]
MLILAFDTTHPDGGAGLYRDTESLGEVRARGKVNYSVALFEMVDQLLADAGLRLADVELFAAATGPGSFTGIRVGLAAAQGWTKGVGRPVRGVSVLEAMVEAAQPQGRSVVPLLDARRGEFYLGVFRQNVPPDAGSRGREFLLSGEGLVLGAARIAALADELIGHGEPGVEFIAREGDQTVLELASHLPATLKWTMAPSFQAAAIARVALRAARDGRLQQPEELDAWYIRRSDAELNWRE